MPYNATAYRNGQLAYQAGATLDPRDNESFRAGYAHAQRASRVNEAPMMVTVITAGNDPDAPPIRTNNMNFNSIRAREWLASHMRWALCEGHTVHIARM